MFGIPILKLALLASMLVAGVSVICSAVEQILRGRSTRGWWRAIGWVLAMWALPVTTELARTLPAHSMARARVFSAGLFVAGAWVMYGILEVIPFVRQEARRTKEERRARQVVDGGHGPGQPSEGDQCAPSSNE
jgi:hypothetical protein